MNAFLHPAYSFFERGGPFMVFLLILSVVALTVIILRSVSLRYNAVIPGKLRQMIDNYEPGESLDPLNHFASKDPSALASVTRVLLRHRKWPRAEALEAIQTKARFTVSRLEKGLVVLEITTGVAPLLGLLGTLSGLVGVFANIGVTGDPTMVARGISEVLNTTIMGLAVATPSLVAHNYFMRKVEIMAVEMESLLADLLQKMYSGPAPRK